jgi:hypothetical protein
MVDGGAIRVVHCTVTNITYKYTMLYFVTSLYSDDSTLISCTVIQSREHTSL